MNRATTRTLVAGACCAALLAIGTPALAQEGTLRGKIVDENGNGVGQVKVVFVSVENPDETMEALTDRFGEYFRNNMTAGRWNISAERFGKTVRYENALVPADEIRRMGDLTLGDPSTPPIVEGALASNEAIDDVNARRGELQVLFAQADADITKGDFPAALAKLTEVAGEIEQCAACYARMGDIYMKQDQNAEAETAFKQALEFDPNLPEVYSAMATLYNKMQRFDDATAMSEKANELFGTSETGGNATTVFNQGVILWNQNKFAEAGEQFKRARELDPKMADAHYRYGMAMLNQGKLAEAKEPFETYLKLDPNGEEAATVKAILAQIGG